MIYRKFDNKLGIWLVTLNLGHATAGEGDIKSALDYFLETLRRGKELQMVPLDPLAGLAGIKAASGEPERALELLGLVMNDPDFEALPETQFVTEPILTQLRAELLPEVVEAALERGKKLDMDEVVEELLVEA